MSYSLTLIFKEIEEKDVLPFCNKVKNILMKKENAIKYIETAKYYFPSIRSHNKIKLKNKDSLWTFPTADEYFLYNLFGLNFVYFKCGLLGLIGGSYPKEVIKEFDKIVYFQNSCDQDYDYDTWKGISIFDKYVEQSLKCKTSKELTKAYKELGSSFEVDDESIDNCGLDYWQRSLCYEMIFKKIGVEKWLYDEKDTDDFYSFSISARGQFTRLDLKILAKYILKYDLIEVTGDGE